MATLGGVGSSTHRQSAEAGRLAAGEAVDALAGTEPGLVLVFATTGFDQKALLGGVRSVVGDVPLSGCSAEGVIAGGASDEGSHAVAVLALASDVARFSTHLIEGVSNDARMAGTRLVDGFDPVELADAKLLLLFPDGLTCNFSQLLRGIDEAVNGELPVVGGAAGDMMKFERTYQYRNGGVTTDSVAAVLVSGDVRADVVVSHGCDLVGPRQTVTKVNGRMLMELDSRPAWDVFCDYLDGVPSDLNPADIIHLSLAQYLTPGLETGYGDYVVRSPLVLDRGSGALGFGAEFDVGAAVSMARRLPHRVRDSVLKAAESLRALQEDEVSLVLVFDCAGRGRALFGHRTNEMAISPIRDAMGPSVPLVGFHTFGEIAKLGARSYYHNYTLALCALREVRNDKE